MPPYELAVIVKSAMNRPELAAALKRSCEVIWKGNGVVRTIENLGERELPNKMVSPDRSKCYRGHYFIFNLDMSVESANPIQFELRKEPTLLRANLLKADPPFVRPCLSGKQCLFGELPVPNKETLVYKSKHLKKITRQNTSARNKKLEPDRYQPVPMD